MIGKNKKRVQKYECSNCGHCASDVYFTLRPDGKRRCTQCEGSERHLVDVDTMKGFTNYVSGLGRP